MQNHAHHPQKTHTHPHDHRIPFASRKLLVGFCVIVVVITAGIAYYSTAKTTLTITRAHFPVRSTFITTLSSAPDENGITGSFSVQTVEHTFATTDLGDTTTVTGKSSGILRVTNNWSQVQPLQATTRFLSPDGVLFRSTERVDVPAGGEAMVPVEADQEGSSGDIPAGTRFTIPGLWAGLQESIYATNDADFTGGQQVASVITQKTIDEAQVTALEELKQKAQAELHDDQSDAWQAIIFHSLLVNQASAPAGTTASELQLTLRGDFVLVSIDPTILQQALYDKITLKLTDDEELVSIDLSQLDVEVDRISDDMTSLQLKMSAVGYAQNKLDSELFSAQTYVGMTESDLRDYAEQETGIESIQTVFSPFWADKTPSTVQRMRIRVQ